MSSTIRSSVLTALFAGLLLGAAHLRVHAQAPSDPGEGLRLSLQPGTVSVTTRWWGRAGHTYFLQQSSDLSSWQYLPAILSGADGVLQHTTPATGDRWFVRLRHTTLTAADPATADFDGDGMANLAELALNSDPLDADTDDDGIPDGVELQPVVSFGVEEIDGVTTANYPLMVSHIFKRGDVPAGVVARIGDVVVPTQTDVKLRWPDGSVRHALVSFIIPQLAAGGTAPVDLIRSTTTNTGAPIAREAVFGSNADLRTEFTIGATTLDLSARHLLTAPGHDERRWLSGPVCTEYIVGDRRTPPQRTHANPNIAVDPFDQLRVSYNVRKFAGWNGVRVFLTVENTWANLQGNVTYDVAVRDAAAPLSPLFARTAVDHTSSARWCREFWIGDRPSRTNIRYNLRYLMDTGMIPNYDTSLPVAATIDIPAIHADWLAADTGILGNGTITKYFPTTGGRQEIGLLPTWTVRYLLTMDWRLRDIALGNAFLAGSTPYHYREGELARPFYGRVLSIVDRPTIWTGNESFQWTYVEDRLPTTPLTPINRHDWSIDVAHQASFAYVPYLVTGEYYLLEEMIFWAGANASSDNYSPGWARDFDKGILHDQVRGFAWGFRNLVHAAVCTPPDFPEKAYLEGMIANNLAHTRQEYLATRAHPILNIWGRTSNRGENGGRPDSTLDPTVAQFESPWMTDFVTISLLHACEIGYPAEDQLAYIAGFLVDRYAHPDFNPYLGNMYHLPVSRTETPQQMEPITDYVSWSEVLSGYIPSYQAKSSFEPGELYPDSYLNISRGSLQAIHGRVNLPRSAAARDFVLAETAAILAGNNVIRDYLTKDPKWGFLPRGN